MGFGAITPGGDSYVLDHLLNDAPSTDWLLRLFQNNVIPTPSSVLGDFVEADFSGYAAQPWPPFDPAIVVSGPFSTATSTSPANWAHNGGPVGNNVYGYLVVDQTTMPEVLIAAELFDAGPVAMAHVGDAIALTLNFGCRDVSQ